jgi:hypothetical protein
MKRANTRVCPVCGTGFSAGLKFCPVCMLSMGLRGESKSAENSPEVVRSASVAELSSQRFEHYQVLATEDGNPFELGRGAMGITYKAFDVDPHCLVTLKVIAERYLGDESARVRFLREARAAASIRHPNVASVLHWAEPGALTSTPWNLWREKRSRISSDARDRLK